MRLNQEDYALVDGLLKLAERLWGEPRAPNPATMQQVARLARQTLRHLTRPPKGKQKSRFGAVIRSILFWTMAVLICAAAVVADSDLPNVAAIFSGSFAPSFARVGGVIDSLADLLRRR